MIVVCSILQTNWAMLAVGAGLHHGKEIVISVYIKQALEEPCSSGSTLASCAVFLIGHM